jgi:hypothetical protein
MPFTLSHPAAVMPLRRIRFLDPLALVIGSMLPDVPYFLPGFLANRFEETHTLRGSLVTDLPLGLLILVVVLLVRRPLVALLSDRARWVFLGVTQRFAARPIHWLLSIPSLVIGCWTHIVWDSFTHEHGAAVRRIEVLSAPISVFGLYDGQVYHLLQYASSLLGLIVLVYWYRELASAAPGKVPAGGVSLTTRMVLLAIVAIAACTIGSIQAYHSHLRLATIYRMAYLLLTRSLAWFGLLYFVVGTLVALAERFVRRRESPGPQAEPRPVRSEIQ